MINKENLFNEICGWYNYEKEMVDNAIVVDGMIPDGIGLNKVGYSDRLKGHFEYNNINEALTDWLSTLEESNYDCDQCEEKHIWNDEEIELIKSLRN